MASTSIFQHIKRIPSQLWILGIAGALLNISAAMIFTISGPFMKDVLKQSSIIIGSLEGIVELASWSTCLVSGILSDYLRNRKTFMILGYITVILSRPLLALATNVYIFLLGRSLDRIGRGLQATPREALVADISPSELRGTFFGLRHSLGMVGSIMGAFLVFYVLKISQYNYRLIFWISSIPALLAVLFLILYVREVKQPENKSVRISLNPKEALALGKRYWSFIMVSVFFMLCRSSEVFITLRALECGMAKELVPFIMVICNLSELAISYPIGKLSDYIGRPICIGIAILLLSLANFLISIAGREEIIFLAALLWGIQRGIGHSIFLPWIADIALLPLRATAYGAFYLISGIALFLSNLIAGIIIYHTSYEVLYTGYCFLGIFPLASLIFFCKKEDWGVLRRG
ncbi:MFS transporter [Candidatus Odyssella thessalonicensis]|uniref:MFS transporter n=1 Tax=Candidatus Odyssella thessalonicensis TaxID=84647 RepID=UPI000225AC6E|nr:MFS transporter [Candidatus Odyssella thessalonicensis]